MLWIALAVVGCHVAGLSLILLQGCQKDANKTAGSGAETNSTPSTLTLPTLDTNPMTFATTSNAVPPAVNTSTSRVAAPVVSTAAPVPPPTVSITPPTVAPASGQEMAGGAASAPTGATTEYKVIRGDTLAGIAKKNHVTIGAIQAANGNIDPKKLMPGQSLKIPPPAASPSPVAAAPAPSTGTGIAASPRALASGAVTPESANSYKVKAGDNMTKIARAHGITVNQLRAANGLKTTKVNVGQVLKIPAKTQNTAAVPSSTSATHQ